MHHCRLDGSLLGHCFGLPDGLLGSGVGGGVGGGWWVFPHPPCPQPPRCCPGRQALRLAPVLASAPAPGFRRVLRHPCWTQTSGPPPRANSCGSPVRGLISGHLPPQTPGPRGRACLRAPHDPPHPRVACFGRASVRVRPAGARPHASAARPRTLLTSRAREGSRIGQTPGCEAGGTRPAFPARTVARANHSLVCPAHPMVGLLLARRWDLPARLPGRFAPTAGLGPRCRPPPARSRAPRAHWLPGGTWWGRCGALCRGLGRGHVSARCSPPWSVEGAWRWGTGETGPQATAFPQTSALPLSF